MGDIYADPFKNAQGEDRAIIKGRLLYINWIKVNGEMVYKAEKPAKISASIELTHTQDNQPAECPFNEQLGNQVSVLKDDPDFDKKTAWLTNSGYEFDVSDEVWKLRQ